jgi:valine--pyruvate aminotransferase
LPLWVESGISAVDRGDRVGFQSTLWVSLSDRNILITPGSQSIYFYAANAFGGYTSRGDLKQIVLPLSPEYTGYGGVSLTPEAVFAYKPRLEIDDEGTPL